MKGRVWPKAISCSAVIFNSKLQRKNNSLLLALVVGVFIAPTTNAQKTTQTTGTETLRPSPRDFITSVSGFVPTMGSVEKDDERNGGLFPQNVGETLRGDQIDISTGNKLDDNLEFYALGELPLRLDRNYNLNWSGWGLFGFKWVSSFDFQLKFGAAQDYQCYASPGSVPCADTSAYSEVWAFRPDGRKIRLVRKEDGVFREMGVQSLFSLTRQEDGRWLLNNETGGTELYSQAGFPERLTNENGLTWTYIYGGSNNTQVQSIISSDGRAVAFVWGGNRIIEAHDPAGNIYRYSYEHVEGLSAGMMALVSAEYPDGMVITYRYAGTKHPWALSGKSYNGVEYASYSYDDEGRAVGSERAGGVGKYSFSYSQSGSDTTVIETNPYGKQTRFIFNGSRLGSVETLESAKSTGAKKTITYDSTGHPDVITGFNGAVSDYDYNEYGQIVKLTEAKDTAAQRVTNYTWNTLKNRIEGIEAVGSNQKIFTYTAENRIDSITEKDLSGLSGIARQTTYSYTLHPNKLVASSVLDGPLEGSGDSLSASFSEKGELLAVKNSLGHSTSYGSYSNLGRPGTKAEPNGLTIEYSYDSRGRVLTERRSTSDGRNSNRNWQYNAGLLLRSSEVTGVTNNYFYNAARDLIGEFIKNSDGTYDSKELTLDAASNVTGFTVSSDNYPANTTIIGKITNVDADADFNYTIHGWACSTGYESPVNVHIYFNGAAGTGTFFTEVTASEPSEAGAIASCAITSTAHNFSLPLTIDQRRTYANQPIYIHGISPVGKDNALLANSGSLVVPAVVDSITAEIIGWTHPDHMVSGESTTITLQIRNTGNTTWQPGETYLAWGTTINSLSDSKALASSVPPGQIATFTWNWTAPELSTSTQSFNFAASMATSGSTWGPHTSTSITVEDLSGNCDGTRCEVPMVLPVE